MAGLRLEAIDWLGGIIRLTGNKSRRTDVLPLPPETGRAIAAYLSKERPVTANRAVFVRHVAPYDDPIRPGVVRKIRHCGVPVVERIRVSLHPAQFLVRLIRAVELEYGPPLRAGGPLEFPYFNTGRGL